MQTIRIDGVASFDAGTYTKVKVDGIGKCDGDLKAEKIDIDGMLRCKGRVTADFLECDGTAKIHGDIRAGEIDVNGFLTVAKEGTRIEAKKIYCDGMIKVKSEVSADEVEVNGYISAEEIVGDSIKIHSPSHRLFNLFGLAKSRIRLIEATHVAVKGVVAENVNGKEVSIGPGSVIENVDCTGILRIADSARVKNIHGKFTTEEYC